MEFSLLWTIVWFVALNELHLSTSVTVKFLNKEPVYIALNKTLVLEAVLELQLGEDVLLQTWERKNGDGEIRVADSGKGNNNRTSVRGNGAVLRIEGFTESDYGEYKFTVTVINGDQVSDSRRVEKITKPPDASLFMLCTVSRLGARWDAPEFSWHVDGVAIRNKSGEISADGSMLHVTELGSNYTCVTDSSQGTSTVQVFINEPEKDECPERTGLIVIVVIESIILLACVGRCVYKKINGGPVV